MEFSIVLQEEVPPQGFSRSAHDGEGMESSLEYRELDRIDREPVAFEWEFFPGPTTLQLLQEIQKNASGKQNTA